MRLTPGGCGQNVVFCTLPTTSKRFTCGVRDDLERYHCTLDTRQKEGAPNEAPLRDRRLGLFAVTGVKRHLLSGPPQIRPWSLRQKPPVFDAPENK